MKIRQGWAEYLLQEFDVTILAGGGSNGFLHRFQELAKAVAFRRCHSLKTHSDAVCGPAPRNHTAKSESFYPDLSIGHPKPDFHLCPRLNWSSGFDQTSACAGVGKVAPDRGWRLIDVKFYSDEALNPRVPSPVASPISAEQIGFKWRGRRRGVGTGCGTGFSFVPDAGFPAPALISRIAVRRASSRFSTGASR